MKIRVGAATMVAGAIAASLAFYTISLRVSAERAEVERLKAQIAADTREVRSLEAELRTRARLPVLQRWNDEVLALQAALPKQFVDSPTQLAAYAPGGVQLPATGPAVPQLAVASNATPTVLPQTPPLQTVAYAIPLARADALVASSPHDLAQERARQLTRPAHAAQRQTIPAGKARSVSAAADPVLASQTASSKPAPAAQVVPLQLHTAEAKPKPAPVKSAVPPRDDPLGALIADVDGPGKGATP